MELRQLRCLIAVADRLHFGRAAQDMDMLPASFGRQIRLLEEHLGCRLLMRTTRHVALTEAGARFVENARDIVARADALEASFRDAQLDRAATLRIGAIDSAAAGLIPQLLPVLRAADPNLKVELMEQKTIRLLPRVVSGRLDVAFIRPPDRLDSRLESLPLFRETAVVAMPSGHALAQRDSISVGDMQDAPLIVPERTSRPHSHDLTMKLFLGAGHTARIAQIAEEKQTIVSLVAMGIGLAIVPRWTARLAVDGVAFVPLEMPEGPIRDMLSLSAVWARDTRHGARTHLLELLRSNLDRIAAGA